MTYDDITWTTVDGSVATVRLDDGWVAAWGSDETVFSRLGTRGFRTREALLDAVEEFLPVDRRWRVKESSTEVVGTDLFVERRHRGELVVWRIDFDIDSPRLGNIVAMTALELLLNEEFPTRAAAYRAAEEWWEAVVESS